MVTFKQAVEEITALLVQKVTIPPRAVEELGKAVEIEERNYHETLAELRRLWLVKRIMAKAKM